MKPPLYCRAFGCQYWLCLHLAPVGMAVLCFCIALIVALHHSPHSVGATAVRTATGDFLPVTGGEPLRTLPAWTVSIPTIMNKFYTEEHQRCWKASWERLADLFPEADPIRRTNIPAGDAEGRYRLLYAHQCQCELWLAEEVLAGLLPVDKSYLVDHKRLKQLKAMYPQSFKPAPKMDTAPHRASGTPKFGPNHARNLARKAARLTKRKAARAAAAPVAKDGAGGK